MTSPNVHSVLSIIFSKDFVESHRRAVLAAMPSFWQRILGKKPYTDISYLEYLADIADVKCNGLMLDLIPHYFEFQRLKPLVEFHEHKILKDSDFTRILVLGFEAQLHYHRTDGYLADYPHKRANKIMEILMHDVKHYNSKGLWCSFYDEMGVPKPHYHRRILPLELSIPPETLTPTLTTGHV